MPKGPNTVGLTNVTCSVLLKASLVSKNSRTTNSEARKSMNQTRLIDINFMIDHATLQECKGAFIFTERTPISIQYFNWRHWNDITQRLKMLCAQSISKHVAQGQSKRYADFSGGAEDPQSGRCYLVLMSDLSDCRFFHWFIMQRWKTHLESLTLLVAVVPVVWKMEELSSAREHSIYSRPVCCAGGSMWCHFFCVRC